ncbi:MAG: hypothetical protein CMH27_06910 [Micavibrio sp.]|nr:hypothetical protein [Micavibrio sp.]
MRIKSLALATTLSLLSSTTLVGTSHAQKGVTLQPQSNWAVKRVNDETPDAYCALARRFKQNLILTLAKNDKHEISFAFDFARGDFDTSKRYDITLDPGAGQQRQFKVSPAGSGKAFVVRVGRDQKFMSALSSTGYLRVVLGGESYNFNLADIDVGQEQLDACLYSGVTPAAGGAMAEGKPSYSQIADLRDEKNALQQRLKKLEQENDQLRLQAANVIAPRSGASDTPLPSALHVTKSSEVDGLMQQISSLKAENAELKKLANAVKDNVLPQTTDVSVIELARENQRLQALLAEQGSSDDYKAKISQLTNRISELESENMTLATRQERNTFSDEDKKDLERQIVALRSENKALRSSIEREGAASNADFSALRHDLADLERKNKSLQDKIAELAEEKSRVTSQLAFYEDENSSLRQAKSDAEVDIDLLAQLRQEIRNIESNNAKALAEKEAQIVTLESDLHALKDAQSKAVQAAQAEQGEAEKVFKTQIKALGVKNEALKAELVKLSKDQSMLDALKTDVESLTEERQRLQDDLKRAQDTIAALQSEVEQEKGAYRDKQEDVLTLGLQVDTLKADIAKLENTVSDLNSKNAALQTQIDETGQADEIANARIETLKSDLADLRHENDRLKISLSEKDKSGNAAGQRIEKLLQENEALRLQLEQKQANKVEAMAALEQKVIRLQSENETLRSQSKEKIDNLEEELSSLQGDLANAQKVRNAELASLRAKLDQAGGNAQTSAQEISQLQDKLSVLQSENKDLRLALSNAEDFNSELQQYWSETAEAYNALKVKEDAIDLANADISGKAKELKGGEQAARIASLQEKNKDLAAHLEAQSREYLALVRDMENLKLQARTASSQNVSVNEAEVNALRANNRNLKGELEALRQKLSNPEPAAARVSSVADPVEHNTNVASVSAPIDQDMKQKMMQNEREEITQLASIEPAAGVDAKVPQQKGRDADISANGQIGNTQADLAARADAARDNTLRNVIDEMEMGDENLSEAQKLERSLKREIQRTAAPLSDDIEISKEQLAAPSNDFDHKQVVVDAPNSDDIQYSEAAISQLNDHDAQHSGGFVPGINVADILISAGIELAEDVSLVAAGSGPDRVAYQWRSVNDLYGSAHQKPLANINDFDNYVRDYLTMTEERCGGDFAIIPSSTEQVNQTRIDSYEIACIGAGIDSSASVVFFNAGGTFTILAHEAPSEGMETAMDARDKIVSLVEKS